MNLKGLINPTVARMVHRAFENWIIVIDDGHGWFTAGKRSTDGSLRENEFNSSVEDKFTFLLDSCEVEHYSLASGWSDENLPKRSQMEKHLFREAKSQGKSTLGISIHCDAYTDPLAHGSCVYYFQKEERTSKNGKILSRYVADSIIESNVENGFLIAPRHERGIKGANFHMLRETDGVWCLVENAFMTNTNDLTYLKSDKFRNAQAIAYLEGFYNYVINF